MNTEELINKMKKIFKKVIFPLEFITSLLMTYALFRFMILANYAGNISIKHIIFIAIFGIATILLIIYNYKQNKEKIEKVVISFLIPIGMLYLIFMMPSHVPDELAHLWRAYEVSEGILVSSKTEETAVPRDLEEKIKPNVENYQQLQDAIYQPTDYNDKVEVNNTAKTYPFILYMFSAIGFIISRTFNLNIIVGCYLAQMMNFIVFLISAYYTLKIIPFGKWAMTAVIFMPMLLHQATSTSSDCLINIFAMLFVAFSMHLIFKKQKIKKKEGIMFVILSILISVSKYVYLPLVGIGLILIFSKNINKKNKIILLTTSIILSTIVSGAYFIFTNTYKSAYEEHLSVNNVNAGEQLKQVISNPAEFFNVLGTTFHDYGETYIYQMVGSYLGWVCIEVPKITITVYLFIMILSCFVEENKVALNAKQKSYCMLIAVGIILLILIGMYLTWTPVGFKIVEGVQGRYFIPLAFLILLCLCKKQNYIKIKNIQYKLPILLCLLNLSAIHSIYKFFK